MGYTSRIRRTMPALPSHVLDDRWPGLWSVMVPEATLNYLPNPSFEVDTYAWGFVVGGGASTATLANIAARFGAFGITFQRSGGTAMYLYHAFAIAPTVGTPWTFSFYHRKRVASLINSTGRFAATLQFQSLGVTIAEYRVTGPSVSTYDWQRVFVTGNTPPLTDAIVAAIDGNETFTGDTVDVDGAMLENKGYATTYCDGEQEGCAWDGIPHASRSQRDSRSRKGGRLMPLHDLKWRTTAMVGLGLAALNTIGTPYALLGGGYYQRSVAPPRDFSIVGGFECDGPIDLANNRKQLVDVISPLTTVPSQPARLVFQPTSCGVPTAERAFIDAIYTGGLEGNTQTDLGIDRHALSFRVFLPYAVLGRSEFDDVVALDFADTVVSEDFISRNPVSGSLAAVSGFSGGFVDAAALGPEGIYAVGNITAPDAGIGLWNGATASALGGGGLTGASARGFAIMRENSSSSYVIGGDFTAAGGVAAASVARFTPGSGYSALGAGTNGIVFAVTDSPIGPLIGGTFTVPGSRFAQWGGAVWNGIGAINNTVFALLHIPGTNDIFVGGAFTSPNNRVAIYRIAVGFFPAGTGFNGNVTHLKLGPDGVVYAAGSFTADGAATTSLYRIAKYVGGTWQPVGNGLASAPSGIGWDSNGILYANGPYRLPDGTSSGARLSAWDGVTWYSPGFQPSASPSALNALLPLGGLDYFIGSFLSYDTYGTTVVTNSGGTVNPTIRITGFGNPITVVNDTTGKAIRFGAGVAVGEIHTLTTGPNYSLISNTRGDLTSTLLANSDTAEFTLVPGANNIRAFATGTNFSYTMTLIYNRTITSLDQVYR